MSKRKGDVSAEDYIEKGYLPEAMINFLAFLGWNPGSEKEIYSIKELLKDFSLEKVHKSGAIFNIDKLDWLNSYYLRKMPLGELTKKIVPFLENNDLIKDGDYNVEYIKKVVALEQPRLKKLSEIGERFTFFFKDPEYSSELLVWRDMLFKDVSSSLNVSLETLSKIDSDNFNRENLEKILWVFAF
jgi:glutamyl/glutaminyl-tRNA synthetase